MRVAMRSVNVHRFANQRARRAAHTITPAGLVLTIVVGASPALLSIPLGAARKVRSFDNANKRIASTAHDSH
jgi:hypothetical protein